MGESSAMKISQAVKDSRCPNSSVPPFANVGKPANVHMLYESKCLKADCHYCAGEKLRSCRFESARYIDMIGRQLFGRPRQPQHSRSRNDTDIRYD